MGKDGVEVLDNPHLGSAICFSTKIPSLIKL